MLNEGVYYDTLRQGLWIAVTISAPILTVALIAGLVIGLFQALTSVQEMTLTFVPKLVAIGLVFWATMGFMTRTLTTYFDATIVPLISGADPWITPATPSSPDFPVCDMRCRRSRTISQTHRRKATARKA